MTAGGIAYQEYRCFYGDDVEGAPRFLFNALAAKAQEGFAFQGIPEAIYTDNGPITESILAGHPNCATICAGRL